MSQRQPSSHQPSIDRHPSLDGTPLRLGRFELLMELSHGGMATLYLARMHGPETFQKLIALKRIHDHLAKEPEFVHMFLDEAKIAARIEHPNVASIYELGESRGSYYMAMEYVHGENLRDIIRQSVQQRRMLPWPVAVKILAEAARGLHAAHELRNGEGELLGVVHRDVSPQNILVSYEGHTKVIDFGIAYAAERVSHTQDGTVKGKLAYMSPEQVAGQTLDRRSDIFSLGIVLFESLCFRRLFKRDSPTATMSAVGRAEVPSIRNMRPGLPEQLEGIVHKALSVNPEHRYQTAADFAHALERLLVDAGHYLSQEDIASVVQGLFAERKARRDEEIREALKRPVGGPPTRSKVTLTEPSSTGFTAATSFLRKTDSTGKALWVTLGLVGLVLLGVAAYFVGLRLRGASDGKKSSDESAQAQRGATTPHRPTPRATTPGTGMIPGKPTKKEMVRVHVSVLPDSAQPVITVAGRTYEASSADIFLPKSEHPVTVRVEAKGFHPKKSIVVPMRDLSTQITLSPIKTAKIGRPRKGRPKGVNDQWFKEPD